MGFIIGFLSPTGFLIGALVGLIVGEAKKYNREDTPKKQQHWLKRIITSKTIIFVWILYLISFSVFLYFSFTEDSGWQNGTTYCNGHNNLCFYFLRYILPIFGVVALGPYFMILLAMGDVNPIIAYSVLFVINLILYTLLGYFVSLIFKVIFGIYKKYKNK